MQRRDEMDLSAARGIAICEFPMRPGFGSADYLLYLDRQAVGAVEAKPHGALTGVEQQTAKYAAGLPENLPARKRPLPFLFESNGALTFFTNGLDPAPRSRRVFNFPRPETLVEWLGHESQLRGRLRRLPPLDATGLWKVQAEAIANLEASLGRGDPRALVQMATGSGRPSRPSMLLTACSSTAAPGASSSWSIAAISASRPKTSSQISSLPTTRASSRLSTPCSG